MNIEQMFLDAKERINIHIEMLYIQSISSIEAIETEIIINEKLIDNYLKKRGYTMNYLLGEKVMCNGFVVVRNLGNKIEVWHDLHGKTKSCFVNESLLTGLPIALKYMERINN
jgi:hypothetical protein